MEHKAPLTKEAFVIACSNKDLSMIKILVDVAKNKTQTLNTEETLFESGIWQNWLFGNAFCTEILQSHQMHPSDLSQYLLQLQNEESFESKKDNPADELEDNYNILDLIKLPKAIYRLQKGDDEKNRSMEILKSFDLQRNINLFKINNSNSMPPDTTMPVNI